MIVTTLLRRVAWVVLMLVFLLLLVPQLVLGALIAKLGGD